MTMAPRDVEKIVLLHDPATLLHETVELLGAKLIPALECPARVTAVLDAAATAGRLIELLPRHLELDSLLADTHDRFYLDHLRTAPEEWRKAGAVDAAGVVLPECFPSFVPGGAPSKPPKDMFARAGFYAFDMSSGIGAGTFESCIASANLAVQSAQALVSNKTTLALCRPPGHHCDTRRAGGYCYINNAVVAATYLRRQAPDWPVTILDLDFHHGNGTQAFFYDRADVRYISIHGEDEYPYYTGDRDEIGAGEGVGENFNFPLATASSADAYLSILRAALSQVRPGSLTIVSLGFDTFELDPLGHFKLGTDDYRTIGALVAEIVGNAAILLEGGYVVDRLGANVESFLQGFESISPDSE